MDNELIRCLEKTKKDLIMNIYENNADTSIDKTNICKDSLHCIDNDCYKKHYLDKNNRKIINEIINTLDDDDLENPVCIEDNDLDENISKLSKEIKEDLKEIKSIELYLEKLKLNVKEKNKALAKEILKLI